MQYPHHSRRKDEVESKNSAFVSRTPEEQLRPIDATLQAVETTTVSNKTQEGLATMRTLQRQINVAEPRQVAEGDDASSLSQFASITADVIQVLLFASDREQKGYCNEAEAVAKLHRLLRIANTDQSSVIYQRAHQAGSRSHSSRISALGCSG